MVYISRSLRDTVNIQNFGAAKFRHFTNFVISAAIYFRRGVEALPCDRCDRCCENFHRRFNLGVLGRCRI